MTAQPRLTVAQYREIHGLGPVEPAPVWRGTGGGRCQAMPIGLGIGSTNEAKNGKANRATTPNGGSHLGSTPHEHEAAIQAAFDGRRSATLVIPGVPVAKGRPRIGQGRAYTPAKTAAWERMAKASARAQWGPEPPLEGPLRVELAVVLPVPRSWGKKLTKAALDRIVLPAVRPDLDNFVKASMDCLNQVAWVDDAQVVEVEARKVYGERPRVVIDVRML